MEWVDISESSFGYKCLRGMNMDECISIIVPIYNADKVLKRCINSLLSQTYKNIEIILVNDGSTDNSLNICYEYGKNFSFIKVINKENGGVSSARNYGLKKATGKYIGFVDADDIIHPMMYKILISLLKERKADIIACDVKHIREKDEVFENQEFSDYQIDILSKDDIFREMLASKKFYGYLCNKVFIKDKCNFLLDESLHYCEDFVYVAQYVSKCNKGIYIKIPLYYYYHSEGNATSDYSFNDKVMTLPKAYHKLVKIYESKSIENLIFVKKNLLKICLNLKGRYYLNKDTRITYLNYLNNKIEKYYYEVMSDKRINRVEKLNILITKLFPKYVVKIKQKITKINQK